MTSPRTEQWKQAAAWIAVLVLLAVGTAQALPPLPPKPKAAAVKRVKAVRYVAPLPSQGMGALTLLSAQVVVVPTLRTNWLAWDYTNLTAVSNFSRYWGPAPRSYTNSVLTGLMLSNRYVWALGTTTYLSVTAWGTNGLQSTNSNEVRLPPAPLTNWVLTVTSSGATNLQWRSSLARGAAWHSLGATNYMATNDWGKPWWRGVGRRTNSVTLRARWE